MERPSYIDLSATSSRASSATGFARPGQPSPRIHHYDGDVPPMLSPLDAFAAESRRLAKELEATRIAGERRMSRLPPQVITKTLTQHHANRPACFRSLSSISLDNSPTNARQDSTSVDNKPEVSVPSQRPMSSYPRISAVVEGGDDTSGEIFDTHREPPTAHEFQEYFGIQRTSSPQSLSGTHIRSASGTSQPKNWTGLAPPSAPFAKHKAYHESSDDDYTSSNAGSTFSHRRRVSNSSGMSFPVSPALPSQHERSPSDKSDGSISSLDKFKIRFSFSRPQSQSSLNPRLESPMWSPNRDLERKPSHLSEEARNFTSFEDDRSVMSDGFVARPTSSYTHKKFVLPRGKMSEKAVERVSQLFAGLSGPTFGWQEPVFPGTPPLSAQADNTSFDLSSPSLRPRLDPDRPSFDPGRPSMDPGKSSMDRGADLEPHAGFSFGFEENQDRRSEHNERPSSSRTAPDADTTSAHSIRRPFSSYNASSFDRNKMPTLPPIPGSTADDMSVISSSKPSTRTTRSASTVRPTTARSQSDYQALSADEHVEKAIDLHQNGDLKESTYHLRIAANKNHPTGMLLYALACRHGWGMRPNAREGVALLRKAVDTAMQELAEDQNASSTRPKADTLEQKSHRAQFALAIYELGISHLNGWGVEQDKALALRCFEIAGTWGDADALTEAGFCYAQGVGCKKNLKKAASLYRQAAEKGVSMVGNSWIYKDKYNDDDDKNKEKNDSRSSRSRRQSVAEDKEKKPRSKSKTRSIFGRKRGNTVTAEG